MRPTSNAGRGRCTRRVVLAAALLTASSLFATGCKREREVVDLATVADAIHHEDARTLRFRGKPLLDKAGIATLRPVSASRGAAPMKPRYRFVIPVVPEGWKAGEPVPLWISPARDLDAPDLALLAARIQEVESNGIEGSVVDHAGREPAGGLGRGESAWQEAIRDAAARHGVASHPSAPVVLWPPRE
jgi:hypothetical protein